ncbi:MAG: T9SS type A sorting domain-containing protein [bacterium]
MKYFILVILLLSSIILNSIIPANLYGQPNNTPKLASLFVHAEVTKEPNPQIKIIWEKHPYAVSYEIRRKNFGDAYFPGAALAQLDTSKTFFTDDNVIVGKGYEYEVKAIYQAKQQIFADTAEPYYFAATGYIYSGIDLELKPVNSKCLLLVEDNLLDALPVEINRLENDLISEGWELIKRNVPRTEAFNGEDVKYVKNIILGEAQKDPGKETYIFILGRVAVPYSGYIVPDGHGPTAGGHQGAWPCDGYYGSLNENSWTDVSVNVDNSSRPENRNIPGDGKFDPSSFEYIPISYPVGRVDFYNMPTFEESETELIKNYLDKDHEYRTGNMPYINRGLIDDNFGMYGLNGFSSSAWRAFPLFFGIDSVHDNAAGYDWFNNLSVDSYLWAYGCGGGSLNSCGGIGVSEQFDTINVNAIFTMLFGSWFGDWDSQNNFMRSALCSNPSVLTCCWAGRPHWFLQHMDMGFPIGFSSMLSQNNKANYIGLNVNYNNLWYYVNQSAQEVHIALMGDPTLRMKMGKVPEPKNLSVLQIPGWKVQVTWNVPDGNSDYRYNIYRSEKLNGPFLKINSEPVSSPEFLDTNILYGSVIYMVRAVKVDTSNSGTFLNLSRGIIQSIVVSDVDDNKGILTSVTCYPNPAINELNISISLEQLSNTYIEIFNNTSNIVKTFNNILLVRGEHKLSWNLLDNNGLPVPSGAYYVRIKASDKVKVDKFTVIR